jgi:hypothetical protein
MFRFLPLIVLLVDCTYAQVVRYDGTVFPESAGQQWFRVPTANPSNRMIENGWLRQDSFVLPCPPDCTTTDTYERQIGDQSDIEEWVMEWVVETNTPLDAPCVCPASIVASGNQGIRYHFSIGNDSVRFLRDTSVFTPINPGPHHYRLELDNRTETSTYRFLIDGKEIDAGIANGQFPTADSFVVFRAETSFEMDNITRWDYIEFGTPLEPIPTTSNWGLAVLCLLLATAGTLAYRRIPATH